ncbi:MAG TPA: exosortase/archaeosortase family protein [Candidatus Acidoferrales bacterium]|nr:exosortase/archaeosortase family protein [Candidatus Acidoferrales bacterium]
MSVASAPALGRPAPPWRTVTGALALAVLAGFVYASNAAALWNTWTTNDNYSHGPLVPLVSLALVVSRRDKLRALPVRGDSRGLLLVALACFMHVAGVRADLFALQTWSLLALLFGLALTFGGTAVTRMLAFPIAYLGFMLTFPPVVMNTLSFALKGFALGGAVRGAEALGAHVHRTGMQIFFPSGELRVEDPCSGLRSLLALLAIATLFAYLQKGGLWRRAVVMLAAIPIALAGNLVRLLLLLVAASARGVDWATGGFHVVTGYAMFVVALALLLALRSALTPRRAPRGGAR